MNKLKKEVVIENNTIEFGINEKVDIANKDKFKLTDEGEELLIGFTMDLIEQLLKEEH